MTIDCVSHAAYPVRCVGTHFRREPIVKSHDVCTGDVPKRDAAKGWHQVRVEFLPIIRNGPIATLLLLEPYLIPDCPCLTEHGSRPCVGVRQPLKPCQFL